MRVPVHKQVWWWSGITAVMVLALWGLGNVMTPFLIGAGIAYVLDPIADRLESAGLSRTKAVALITIIAVLAFLLALTLVVPMVVRQLAQFIEAAPGYFETAQTWLSARFPRALPEGGTLRSALTQLGVQLSQRGGEILIAVLSSVRNVIGVLLLLVIVPVVAFYLLLDWDRMVARIDEMLPREHADTIRGIAYQINDSMAGFLRGQGLVTLILATFYSVSLFAVGLPFGLVIGITAAVLSIIPYVGVFTGGVISVAVAAFAFWDQPYWIAVVLAIFATGQFIEGNYLQPKIIGGHVGLHPVWLMIALAVFGKLFGFVGLIVAVPLGAIIGVLARFFVERYKESALYTGTEVPPPPPQPTLVELVPRGTVAQTRARAKAAHQAAVAEVKVDDARAVAHRAAEDAAKRDHAKVAIATAEVLPEGADGGLEKLMTEVEVRTWGGKAPDGADPDKNERKHEGVIRTASHLD
ncbi:MAG TPA: AI-2E family transporter [Paracoccus sp. (in: a-proteobacteria)]|nr:AI-2E family transporter [Paracoccus sp. (in: a-proteobacteria)]